MKLNVGDAIPSLAKNPTSIGMFRFSAVMWNAHRTHVDHPYATGPEGHASTLVQDYLLASYLTEMLMKWGGPKSRLKFLGYRNRGPVHANTQVNCWGKITAIEETKDGKLVSLDVGLDTQEGLTSVPGTARILLPAA